MNEYMKNQATQNSVPSHDCGLHAETLGCRYCNICGRSSHVERDCTCKTSMIDELIQKEVEEFRDKFVSIYPDGAESFEEIDADPEDIEAQLVRSMKKVAEQLKYDLRYCPHCHRMVNSLVKKD